MIALEGEEELLAGDRVRVAKGRRVVAEAEVAPRVGGAVGVGLRREHRAVFGREADLVAAVGACGVGRTPVETVSRGRVEADREFLVKRGVGPEDAVIGPGVRADPRVAVAADAGVAGALPSRHRGAGEARVDVEARIGFEAAVEDDRLAGQGAVDEVGARAARERVRALAADKRVVALRAGERVGPRAAFERVRAAVAGQRVAEGRPADVLDGAQRVAGRVRARRRACAEVDGHAAVRARVAHGVDARAAVDDVAAVAAFDHVRAGVARQRVGVIGAGQVLDRHQRVANDRAVFEAALALMEEVVELRLRDRPVEDREVVDRAVEPVRAVIGAAEVVVGARDVRDRLDACARRDLGPIDEDPHLAGGVGDRDMRPLAGGDRVGRDERGPAGVAADAELEIGAVRRAAQEKVVVVSAVAEVEHGLRRRVRRAVEADPGRDGEAVAEREVRDLAMVVHAVEFEDAAAP